MELKFSVNFHAKAYIFQILYDFVRCGAWHDLSSCSIKKQISIYLGFPCDSAGKESAFNVGDLGSIPGLGRSPGGGKGYPLQHSGLENSMDYSPWGHKESNTTEQLSLYTHTYIFKI